jgi:hypothetical protein
MEGQPRRRPQTAVLVVSTFTAEVYYNKTYKQLNTEFLNYAAPTSGPATAPDGRPRFNGTIANTTSPAITGRRRVSTGGPAGTGFADVLLLTNTDKGEAKGITIGIQRPMANNWSWGVSWTHGSSTEVTPMTSSTASSDFFEPCLLEPE